MTVTKIFPKTKLSKIDIVCKESDIFDITEKKCYHVRTTCVVTDAIVLHHVHISYSVFR